MANTHIYMSVHNTHIHTCRHSVTMQTDAFTQSYTHSTHICMYICIPSKNTLGVKTGEAKSEAPVTIKTTESTGD